MATPTFNFDTDSAALNKELQEVLKGLSDVPKQFTDTKVRQALRHALAPVRQTARAITPRSDKAHYRYEKNTGKKKGKGKGVIKAIYAPGHLSKSLRILTFRRSKRALFVGPKFDSKAGRAGGLFGASPTKVDAYYAHMVFGSAIAYRKQVTERALNTNREVVVARFFSKAVRIIQDIKLKYNL
jgi:hypothetical protein